MSVNWESTSSGLQHYLDNDGVVRTGFDSASSAQSADYAQEFSTEELEEYSNFLAEDNNSYAHFNLLYGAKAERVQRVFDTTCWIIGVIAVLAIVALLFLN